MKFGYEDMKFQNSLQIGFLVISEICHIQFPFFRGLFAESLVRSRFVSLSLVKLQDSLKTKSTCPEADPAGE